MEAVAPVPGYESQTMNLSVSSRATERTRYPNAAPVSLALVLGLCVVDKNAVGRERGRFPVVRVKRVYCDLRTSCWGHREYKVYPVYIGPCPQ